MQLTHDQPTAVMALDELKSLGSASKPVPQIGCSLASGVVESVVVESVVVVTVVVVTVVAAATRVAPELTRTVSALSDMPKERTSKHLCHAASMGAHQEAIRELCTQKLVS